MILKEYDAQGLNRSFGLVMAGGMVGLALLRYAFTGAITWWLLVAAGGFLALGLLVPVWLGPIRRAWMRLAAVLGVVNSQVLLTVVFACLFTPLALLLRLLSKQPIQTTMCKAASTYWHKRRPEEFTAQRMERQF